ncbi:MAG: hypothetical protein H6Q68_2046 [Firmicutes bacterium]|nr:hypothetical protein [Bacillota bacterium]
MINIELSENINIIERYWLLRQMPYNGIYTSISKDIANVFLKETITMKL